MKVKVESKKVGLKLYIQKTKIMACGPITSWQVDGETMETVREFIFFDSQITADGDYSHEINERLLLGREVMTNLDSILIKHRHYLLVELLDIFLLHIFSQYLIVYLLTFIMLK